MMIELALTRKRPDDFESVVKEVAAKIPSCHKIHLVSLEANQEHEINNGTGEVVDIYAESYTYHLKVLV